MLIVNNWFGRTGNNILQLIRAIHYAKINNHNNIKFNKHSLLNKCEIIIELDTNITINKTSVIDTFFYLDKFDMIDINIDSDEEELVEKKNKLENKIVNREKDKFIVNEVTETIINQSKKIFNE